MRSPTERFLLTLGAGLAERLEPQEAVDKLGSAREAESDEGVRGWSSGISKTWWVGRQSCSVSAAPSGVIDILSILEVGCGDADD